MRLRGDVAPMMAARILALVRDGYYDGLSWHLVEHDFVIQGGSPGAQGDQDDGRPHAGQIAIPLRFPNRPILSTPATSAPSSRRNFCFSEFFLN